MKNIIIIVLLLSFSSSGQSQQMMRMDELHFNGKTSASLKFNPYTNFSLFKIREAHAGQFRSHPLNFVQENFDIHKYIEANKVFENETYRISFSSKSGFINVTYNNKGKIMSTHQEFRNVFIPKAKLDEIKKTYPGWSVVNNKRIDSSNKEKYLESYYKIRIKNGNMTKIVKLTAAPVADQKLALQL